MNETPNKKLANLQWSVESRNKNQQCALKLFELLTTYRNQIRRGKYEQFAQSLVGVTFSLWRAAFLADKIGGKEKLLNSAIDFLETVIADNAISYAQDKKQREWTFNYYTNNVRFTLAQLKQNRKWTDMVPEWRQTGLPPKKRWEQGQKALSETVARFESVLGAQL